MHGEYIIKNLNGEIIERIPNTITKKFEELILTGIMRNDFTDLSTFYIGLCNNETIDRTTVLSDLTEVTGTGYARQELARNSLNWNVPVEDINSYKITSKDVTFTAGGLWTGYNRLFIASGNDSSAELLSVSAPSLSPTVLDTNESVIVAYALYLA